MFTVPKQSAESYLKGHAMPASPTPVPPTADPIGAVVLPIAPPTTTQPLLVPTSGSGLAWTGEIPPQKWMNFYTKVLSKFASARGLKLTVKVEASPEGGVSKQKLDETKSALRELGLNDDIKAE